MTLFDIIYSILIGPLKLVFEIIYVIANRFIGHPGLAIIILSLIMNFLVLPLYKRSDAMQEEARDTEAKLSKGVEHIKKTFSGDERMMIMQTYYRQNNYKPTDALNGSVSLLLEVPFFMAAYQFLSHLETIQGVSLGPIANLGEPDALLSIGGMSINLLPILMTLVNVISAAIYLKGFPLKTKIQLYGMAGFFLVFLYTSPSGLVFYWTLNNVFSLVKTIFYKLKNPKKVLSILASIVGLVFVVIGIAVKAVLTPKRFVFMLGMGLLLQAPLLLSLVGKKIKFQLPERNETNNKKLFVLGCLFLTVLVGALIPSTIIATSPQEFIDITYFYNPVWYIVSALCLAAGTFLVWFGVFYWIASPKGKVIFDKVVWILCGIMVVNYMFFGTELGLISKNLQYELGLVFSTTELVLNVIVLIAVGVVMYMIVNKWKAKLGTVILTALIAIAGMSGLNIVTIQDSVVLAQSQVDEVNASMPQFNLSKTGKNVIVIQLDRALGEYIPYIMKENPELMEKFSGFTYYSNVVSFGGYTNFGTAPLYGGYEYTPVEMNKRDDELLVDKQNEALKVMPVLFSQNGYDVTVCDVPYANYQWIPDMSIYDEYPEIDAYITEGVFMNEDTKQSMISSSSRNFFCFSIMKVLPLVIQDSIYEHGNYNQAASSYQTLTSIYEAKGQNNVFMGAYTVLENLANITKITDEPQDTFLMMNNNATHEPTLLQLPDYTVSNVVDNKGYYENKDELYTINGVTLKMETELHVTHYQVNMAAYMRLAEWFDYLREQGVYDNTRIILVSDHGRTLYQMDELLHDEKTGDLGDLELYYPLLMVKDFNSEGFTTSTEFMTNADVATLATQGVIENPVNPFTGKEINNDEKYAHDQYVIASLEANTNVNNGTQFIPGTWFAVSDNIWDINNWKYIDVVTTDPESVQ